MLGSAAPIRALPNDVVVIGMVCIAYIKVWYTKRADGQHMHERISKMHAWNIEPIKSQRSKVKVRPVLNYNEPINMVEHQAVDYNEPLDGENLLKLARNSNARAKL